MSERDITVLGQIYNLAQDLRLRMRDTNQATNREQQHALQRADYAWKTLQTALEEAALQEPDVGAVLAELGTAARAVGVLRILVEGDNAGLDIGGFCAYCDPVLWSQQDHTPDCPIVRGRAALEGKTE